jgi:hypothetical protein
VKSKLLEATVKLLAMHHLATHTVLLQKMFWSTKSSLLMENCALPMQFRNQNYSGRWEVAEEERLAL